MLSRSAEATIPTQDNIDVQIGVDNVTRDYKKNKGMDRTLRDITIGNKVPWSAFVLLLLMYIIPSFFTRYVATNPGVINVTLVGGVVRSVPFSSFAGVLTAIANLALMFLVILFKKSGYITTVVILVAYQLPSMVIQFVKAGNTNVVAGLFTNLFTLVAVTVIYFMNKKNMRYQQRITSQAITDRLTDLPNRFAVSELIEKLIRDQERFTFLSIDINNFKTINDTMGHDFGDNVLIEIANRWRDLAESDKTETKDFVARLGGDEFALIIRGYDDVGQIKRSVHKYKDELERVITIEECDYFMTANFGYAEYPTDAMTSNAIISGANAAMHAAGKKGENNILRYDPDALKDVRSMEVERIIRRALENNTITFNLQPQYDISHRLRGFEALARLKDEDGTMISPGEFIPVAEKTGLVDQIDSRVFELAVEFVSRVMNETLSNITMCVNVSVRHLMKNNFIEEVRNMLEKYGVPAHFIEIEITESIMIDSTDKARNTISELKAMGIKIAIDDFGTGYSSLSYLNNLPSDILKIDKSFIDVMNNTESNKQYVSMIVSIGHILNLKVISEGVESDDQVDTLKEIGCDYIQGFVWGRPMPAENAMLLVLKDN